MGKKITGFKTKGMNRDLSVSAFNPEFSFENINLRLSTNEGNTMLSWVNERGPLQLSTVNASAICASAGPRFSTSKKCSVSRMLLLMNW